jgi:hypothetical protein
MLLNREKLLAEWLKCVLSSVTILLYVVNVNAMLWAGGLWLSILGKGLAETLSKEATPSSSGVSGTL